MGASEERTKADAEHDEVATLLMQDVQDSANLIATSDTQFHRRAYLRAGFAYVEATTYQLKQSALVEHRDGYISLSPAEISLLTEKSYELNSKIEIVERDRFLPVAANLRFAFSMFAKSDDVQFTLNLGDHRWEKLQHAITVRNRITHPKQASDCHISDDDLLAMRVGFRWYMDELIRLFKASSARSKEIIQKVNQELQDREEKFRKANESRDAASEI